MRRRTAAVLALILATTVIGAEAAEAGIHWTGGIPPSVTSR